jgi:hypothetical protein
MAFCLQSQLAKQVPRKQLGSKQANHPRKINLYRLHCLPGWANPSDAGRNLCRHHLPAVELSPIDNESTVTDRM